MDHVFVDPRLRGPGAFDVVTLGEPDALGIREVGLRLPVEWWDLVETNRCSECGRLEEQHGLPGPAREAGAWIGLIEAAWLARFNAGDAARRDAQAERRRDFVRRSAGL